MTDTLSQEEIDAMMNSTNPKTEKSVEKTEYLPEATTLTASMDGEGTRYDLLGEVGNISMSQAATTLSSILNRRVNITTPKVQKCKFGDIINALGTPKVATTVEFKEGLLGSNLMVLDVKDANIIADLMMGGEGVPASTEFTEIELSAVGEAMNQMIGSASTSMSTMIERKVDILPPNVMLWNGPENIEYDQISLEEDVYRIAFSLTVEGLIESEIMQIFNQPVVEEIERAMLGLNDLPTIETSAEVPTKPVVTAEPSAQTNATSEPAEISTPLFPKLEEKVVSNGDNLDLIMDVPLNLSVVLGRSKKKVRDILALNEGSVVELDNLTDEPLDILLNGKLIAQGEVVVINENFGIRITNISTVNQRLQQTM